LTWKSESSCARVISLERGRFIYRARRGFPARFYTRETKREFSPGPAMQTEAGLKGCGEHFGHHIFCRFFSSPEILEILCA